ncbi:hypothetical protein [Roseateles koreensis]|uniref:Uncharacterized protein n=1 Tax=Roseateles koreensis TaxID=2987526 RepID=A0ABT5KRR8_9BURK|nr:hypothetical protein [Roseateles koreensis]MDC8785536.1 hypothetical protein [Roseateles koreensis]
MTVEPFEMGVIRLLEAQGFWVRRGVTVNLTVDEKRQIGKQASARPIIDVLALHVGRNELLALEVKSYADTPGVKLAQLQEVHEVATGRFKLFTSPTYRDLVLSRLRQDLVEGGRAPSGLKIQLGMVAGKISQGQSQAIAEWMGAQGWLFWSPDDVKAKLAALTA